MGGLSRLFGTERPTGIVLALGGGGARGVCHLGVLRVLEEAGIPVIAVAGTSAGSVAGALWLAEGSAAAAQRRWHEFLASGLLPSSLPDTRLTDDVSSRDNLLFSFARKLRRGATVALAFERRSLISREDFDAAIAFLLPDLRIQQLRMPFAAVATDFETGLPIAIRKGPLRFAVAASSAIPGIIPPYPVGSRALVDGGVVADVPVAQAQALAPGRVVAVDAGELPGADSPEAISMPRAMLRAGVMTHRALRELILRDADLVLRPRVHEAHWSEFARSDEMIAAGEEETSAHLEAIRRLASAPPRRRAERASP